MGLSGLSITTDCPLGCENVHQNHRKGLFQLFRKERRAAVCYFCTVTSLQFFYLGFSSNLKDRCCAKFLANGFSIILFSLGNKKSNITGKRVTGNKSDPKGIIGNFAY